MSKLPDSKGSIENSNELTRPEPTNQVQVESILESDSVVLAL